MDFQKAVTMATSWGDIWTPALEASWSVTALPLPVLTSYSTMASGAASPPSEPSAFLGESQDGLGHFHQQWITEVCAHFC